VARPQDKPSRSDPVSRHDAPIRSPNRVGSGASTPTHQSAPPAPSMLPVESRSQANAGPRRDNPVNGNPPMSLQSLRNLRDRRRAIVAQINPSEASASSTTTQIEVKLKAQQLEITQLRRERDELHSRLKNMESSFQNFSRLADGAEQQKQQDSSKALQPILARLDALEKPSLASQVQSLQKEIAALKPVEDRLAAVEVTLPGFQKDLDQMKPALKQLETSQAETASDTAAKISTLEIDMGKCKRSQESQQKETTTLNTWKASQSNAITEDTVKKLVMEKVRENTENTKASTRREMSEVEARLSKRISSEQLSLRGALDKLKDVQKDVEALTTTVTNIPSQLTDIRNKFVGLQSTCDKTRIKVSRIEKDFGKDLHVFDKDLGKFERDLEKYVVSCRETGGPVDVSFLATRVDDLERAERGSPGISSSSVNTLAQNVELLAKDFLSFQIAQKESKSLESKVANMDQRLENIERVSQDFETLKKRIVLDKSLEDNLTKLDQRISEEVRILRMDLDSKFADIQIHQSRVASEVVPPERDNDSSSVAAMTRALEAQIKDIQTEIDSLSDEFNEAGQKIHEHSTTIAVIQNQVPELFRQQFDPFKSTVQEQLETIDAKLGALALKKDVSLLKLEMMASIQTLATKPDIQDVEKKMDGMLFALKDLEHRYQNISTDEIYQKMVHWFVQMYPTSAMLLRDTAQLQQDVSQLKVNCNELLWVRKRSEVLRGICQNAGQLETLARNASHLQNLANNVSQILALTQQHSPPSQNKVEQACSNAEMALTRIQQVGREVHEQAKMLSALQSQLHTEVDQRASMVQELRTIHSNNHEKRIEVEQRIKMDINELKLMNSSLEPQVSQIAEQVADVQMSAYQHRRDFDAMRDTLIEPNRDFFGLFGTVLSVLAQLQQIVESLNKNQPGAPMKLDWEYYLPALVEQSTADSSSSNDKEKGKSKQ
jgi:chromosome segregation ATPase